MGAQTLCLTQMRPLTPKCNPDIELRGVKIHRMSKFTYTCTQFHGYSTFCVPHDKLLVTDGRTKANLYDPLKVRRKRKKFS